MPALLTSAKAAELRHTVIDGDFPLIRVRHIQVSEMNGIAECFGDLLSRVVEHVADHDARPLRHQRLGVGSAHAAGATADHHDLAVDSSHGRSA